MSISLILEK